MQGLNNALCYFRPYLRKTRRLAQRESSPPVGSPVGAPAESQISGLDPDDDDDYYADIIDPAVELAIFNGNGGRSQDPVRVTFEEPIRRDETEQIDETLDRDEESAGVVAGQGA